MKHIKLFEQFLNENATESKIYKDFLKVYDADDLSKTKDEAKKKGITVVLFLDLKGLKMKDWPKNSVIFIESSPEDDYYYKSDLEDMDPDDLEYMGMDSFSSYVDNYGDIDNQCFEKPISVLQQLYLG